MLITVTLYYWRVAAALDVGKQFAQPCVRDSLILIVDIVLHLKVRYHHHHHLLIVPRCAHLELPAGVDLVCAALPAAGPGAVLLALAVLAPHSAAHAPGEPVLDTRDGRVWDYGQGVRSGETQLEWRSTMSSPRTGILFLTV